MSSNQQISSKPGAIGDLQTQNPGIQSSNIQQPPIDEERMFHLVHDISVPELSEQALAELSRHREVYSDLALVIWYSYGTVTTLLHEIISVYQYLHPPTLTAIASTKVCNSLALLQCVASHPQTRRPFLNAQIPLFLYPFLNIASKSRPLEYLRLTCLGVIGALVKTDDPVAMGFLLDTEIIPLCLRIMETGSDISKTILLDDRGLNYVCETANRFYTVASVLSTMVNASVEAPSRRLLKHITRCYLRLTDNPRAKDALSKCLPPVLRKIDPAFYPCIKEEPALKKWLLQLICNTEPTNNQGMASQRPGISQPPKQQLKNHFQMPNHVQMQPGMQHFNPSSQVIGHQIPPSQHRASPNFSQVSPNFAPGSLSSIPPQDSRNN